MILDTIQILTIAT